MTQQDNWRPEMARLAQRQDQLERQQRETTTRVDAVNRDVDRRIDSLRREMDRQFRDGERRVSSLERSRRHPREPFLVFDAPGRRRCRDHYPGHRGRRIPGAAPGSREPEQRSPSSVDAPLVGSGGPLQPGFVAAGTPFRQLHRSDDINAAQATVAGGPGNYLFLSIFQPVKNGHRLSLSPIGSAVSSPSVF